MTPIRLLALVGVALAACSDDATGAPADDGGDDTRSRTTVEMRDFAFARPDLVVDAGSTVVFVNADDTAHTATARDGTFSTDSVAPGEEGSVEVTEPGTYAYFCTFHPFMEASLTVE